MSRFIQRRLLQAIPTIFGIMVVTFLLTRLSPADPVDLMVGQNPSVTEQDKVELREALGLNDPLPIQFARWSLGVLRLDFGTSFSYHRPVIEVIAERIPNSLQLSVAGLIVGLLVGVPLGVVAALMRGRLPDHVIRVVSSILNTVPDFFLGLLIILFLGIQLRVLPVGSMNSVGLDCFFCWDRLWHMAGPVLLAANGAIAVIPRLLRTELLEILGQDFMRTARAKGLRERVVIIHHGLRNALIPLVSIFGSVLTLLLGGSVIIEQVFNWPGLGRLLFESASAKDYPVMQASVLVGSFLLVISYILRDIAYGWVDPRIRVGG